MKNVVSLALLIVVSFSLAGLTATTPSQHLKLVESSPAKDATIEKLPADILLRYNQAINLKDTRVSLTFGEQNIALTGPTSTDKDPKSVTITVPDSVNQGSGAYVIQWATSGDDGHVVKGELGFAVK